jgi:ABC-type antimicrobial peptide transport system permease subunit
VFGLVLKSGVVLTALGAAIGLAGSTLAARAIRSELFETGPLDPLAVGSAMTVLCLVALAAVCVPARRSTRIDPIETIRQTGGM